MQAGRTRSDQVARRRLPNPTPWSDSSVRPITIDGPGVLLVCTDGLWNYLPEADDIARICGGYGAAEAAGALVDYALSAGGQDNITVVSDSDRRILVSTAEQQSLSGIAVDVDHNPYLAEGAGTVDAIISVAVGNEMVADKPPGAGRGHHHRLLDLDAVPAGQVRGSRNGPPRQRSTKWSTAPSSPIVAGTEKAEAVYPEDGQPTRASEASRAAAARAVDGLRPNGGTAIGTWLAHVRQIAGQHPGALTHAILLTDGKDEHETPEKLGEEIGLSEGEFTCDCRGVGTDWRVEELRAISSALLGTVDIVADPADLVDDFAAMMRASMGKSIPDLTLRLWTPAGATVAFVKQVAPTVEDLTQRRVDAGSQCGEYPLGAWGAEERDYHIQVEVEPAAAGREKLAARVTVVAGDEILGEGLVKAMWTTDTALSARISQPGRALHGPGGARAGRPGRAGRTQERRRRHRDRKTAAAQWNSPRSRGTTAQPSCSREVIEVDEHTGTARLRRDVAAADEMALDARSTRTARVRKEA